MTQLSVVAVSRSEVLVITNDAAWPDTSTAASVMKPCRHRRGPGVARGGRGPGIAPELRATVFDRFVRGTGHDVAGSGSGSGSGSGLGLAIVRQAARRSGGDVVLRDGPHGRGCHFEVRLAGAGDRPR